MHRKHVVLKGVDLVKVGEVMLGDTKMGGVTPDPMKVGEMTSDPMKVGEMTSDPMKVGGVTPDTTKMTGVTPDTTKMTGVTPDTAKPIVMTSGPNTIAGQFTLKPLKPLSLVDARFPRVDVTDVVCGEYSEPAIDTSKLSCLLPGAMATRSELPAKGLKIREPHNWMGVSISDLGRGYAWSDYIQLVGVAWWVDG